jgi:methyl-accepting chemotaxis protein
VSLKAKFVTGLIIVLVLTTLGVSGAIFRSMYVDVMAQTEVSMRAQAEMLAGETAVWFAGIRNAGGTLAANSQLTRGTPEEVQGLLGHLQKNTPGFESVFVLNRAGRLTQIYPFNQQLVGVDFTDRAYFKEIVAGKDFVASTVIKSRNTGASIFILAYPLKGPDGALQGMLGLTVDIRAVQERVRNVKAGETGYAALFGTDMKLIAHKDTKLVDEGKTVPEAPQKLAKENSKAVISYQSMTGVQTLATVAPVPGSGWFMGLVIPEKETYQAFYISLRNAAIVLVIALLLAIGLSWWFFGRMFRPLVEMTGQAERFGKGDFSIPVSVKTRDEVGRVGEALNNMREGLRSMIRQVSQSSEQLAASSQEMNASATQSADAANNVAESISHVAAGADRQVKIVGEAVTAIEDISRNIGAVTSQAGQVVKLTGQTAQAGQSGRQALNKVSLQMKDISDSSKSVSIAVGELSTSSKKIVEIVGLISGIAGQTNLLALNAAIEAARAGEQGRGFAVVAEEVRKLAEQSETAAQQIAELIGQNVKDIEGAVRAMQVGESKVGEGTKVMQEAGSAFDEIAQLIENVKLQVDGMNRSVEDVAKLSERIVSSTREIEKISQETALQTQNVSAATEEQSASMQEIASASHTLSKLAQDLQVGVQRFRV